MPANGEEDLHSAWHKWRQLRPVALIVPHVRPSANTDAGVFFVIECVQSGESAFGHERHNSPKPLQRAQALIIVVYGQKLLKVDGPA